MKPKHKIPEWALKYKVKGTQITPQGNNYYLYKISSKWDPEKKRSKKTTEEYLGKITPEGVIPPKHKRNNDLTFLKKDDKILQQLQIIKEINTNKNKIDIAKQYGITTKTIDNIKKRFDKDGVKGLIHTRKNNIEIIKVSTPEQAAIITDFVKNPNKDIKEIKKTTFAKSTISEIKKIISPIEEYLKLKKKIMLEIQ